MLFYYDAINSILIKINDLSLYYNSKIIFFSFNLLGNKKVFNIFCLIFLIYCGIKTFKTGILYVGSTKPELRIHDPIGYDSNSLGERK
jgi:hypothetical protein